MTTKSNKTVWLIAAGGAGLLLVMMLLSRKKTSEEASAPVYTAVPSSGTTASEVGAAEIAQRYQSLTEQLPQAIAGDVQAALASQHTTESGEPQTAAIINSLANFAGALTQRTAGEQVGGGTPSPSSPAPTVQVTLSPALTGAAPATPSLPAALTASEKLPKSAYPILNPKSGRYYRDVLWQGREAHEYFGTLPGGKGPHHDIIEL